MYSLFYVLTNIDKDKIINYIKYNLVFKKF